MNFDKQPILSGDLVFLRPLELADYDALWSVASDRLLWEQHPAWDRYKEPVFKTLFEESINSGGCLVIIDQESNKIIGSSRYWGYDEELSEIEIGWTFLNRKYWGGTYNREIKQLMLEHAFKFVNRVIFMVGVNNIRSQKAMEKIGGVRESLSEDTGGNASYVYVITDSEFA